MTRNDIDYELDEVKTNRRSRSSSTSSGGSGFLGKLIALLLGVVIGIVGGIGGLAYAGYYIIANNTVKDTMTTVNNLTGLQIDLSQYISDEYSDQTLLALLSDVGAASQKIMDGTGTLNDLNEISPYVGTFVTGEGGLLSILAGYGLELDANEVMNKYLIGGDSSSTDTNYLSGYVMSEVKNMPVDGVLKAVGMEGNALLDILIYGIEDEDYTRDEQGNIVMNEGKEALTIGGLGNADLIDRIMKAPAGSFMKSLGVEGNDLLDMLIYGMEGEDYTLVDGEKVMLEGKHQLTLEELMGNGMETRLDKLPIDTLIDVDVTDAMMLAVAYGAQHRYTVQGDTVEMNPIEYTFQDGKAYENNEEVAATVTASTQSDFVYELTFSDGAKQYVKLVDGAYVAYRNNGSDFEVVRYSKNTVGNLQEDMTSLVDDVTLADVLKIEKKDGDVMSTIAFDSTGRPRTIGELRDNQAEIIDTITLSDALGIKETDTGMLHSIAFDKDGNPRTLADFKDGKGETIINGVTLADALGIKSYEEETNNFKKALAYAPDGRPYTLGELSDDPEAIVYNIHLDDIIPPNPDDPLVMYLLYGKEDIHFIIKDALAEGEEGLDIKVNGEDKFVVMLQQIVAVHHDTDDTYHIHNEYGEALYESGDTLFHVDELTGEYQFTYQNDGVTYFLKACAPEKEIRIIGPHANRDINMYAPAYYVFMQTAEGEIVPVQFKNNSLEALTKKDSSLLSHLTDRLTLEELLPGVDMESNFMLKHLSHTVVSELPHAIETLTIAQIFEKDVYKTNASGSFLNADGNVVVYDATDERWELPDGTPSKRALTGTWAYLLTNDTTPAEEYTLIQMDEMMTNMTTNVTNATLFQLKADGLIANLDENTLNQDVSPLLQQTKITIGTDEHGNPIEKTLVELGYTKLGHFTVEHLLTFVGKILSA